MLLEVNDLHFSYGKLKVLWGINIKIDKGEFIGLIGPNGMGKTTTLKNIIGVLTPSKGDILFDGENVTQLPPYERIKRGMSLVPEGDELFPYMSVKENLELGAYLKEAREKIHDSLEQVYNLFPRLKERERQLAGTLSGGERRMLSIGRALMSRPKLLMLDEPSMGLAPRLATEVLRTIKKLNEESGLTILLVEQNIKTTLNLCHRSYLIESGKIIHKDYCSNMLNDPKIKETYLGI
ncbi:MAG: ABC transporter ATP-binding protein [Fervidicoccaceae archaeon]